jgi:hypothetical protein
MPRQVAAVRKNSQNVDAALFPGAVDDKVAGVPHDPRNASRPLTAEADVIRPKVFLNVASLPRSGPLRIGLDIAKRLDNQVFIPEGVAAKVFSSVFQDFPKIATGGLRKGRSPSPRFLATLRLSGDLSGYFLASLPDVVRQIVHGSKLDAFAPIEGIRSFLGGGSQPFEFRPVFFFALLQALQAFADHFATDNRRQ